MRIYHAFNRLNLALTIILSLCTILQKTDAAPCPCDIYKSAATPCVAAHSTVRALFESYNGPLYQVRRTSDNVTKEIGVLSPGGFANTAAQDSFLNGKAGTISIIYDQTSNKNDLLKAGVTTWMSSGGKEANAAEGKIIVSGHAVHGIFVTAYSNIAYRNNATTGIATGDKPESMYMVVDGKRSSDQCCFDYGNAETSGKDDGNGTMEALYWGKDISWGGKGEGTGPWVAADLENGVFKCDKGGWQSQSLSVPNAKTVVATFATAMLKGPSGNHFGLKAGNAQSGKLTTMWDGARPSSGYTPMKKLGAIILGTGGDGSNGGTGTFFEGAMTAGNPPDSVDDKIQANIVAAGYGNNTALAPINNRTVFMFDVHCTVSDANAVINYTLRGAQRVNMTIFNQQGKQIAAIAGGIKPAGQHQALWDMKRVPAGVYVAKMTLDDRSGWAGKIIKGK